jgi:hypothetical protein
MRLLKLVLVAFVIAGAVAADAGPRAAVAAQSVIQALDATTPITYFIAPGRPETRFKPADRQLAAWAFQAWQRSAMGRFTIRPSNESTARVRLYWAEASDGQYGEMRPLMVNGRRGSAVFIRPDTGGLGADMAGRAARDPLLRDTIVYLTCLHELGHAFGLSHTDDFRDIMYSFQFGGDIAEYFGRYRRQIHNRADIATVSGISAADSTRLLSMYPRH